MDLRQLRYFLSVARHGNFHRAAEELYLSQQALSASISALERDLGVPLIVRGRQGATLSRFGQALVPRAQALLLDARTAQAELQGMLDETQGHLRVGAGAFFVQHVFPEALLQFVARFPKVDVTILEGPSSELYAALTRGELDFVVSTRAAEVVVPPDIEAELLFETTDAVFVGDKHPLASREAVDLIDLVDLPWIVSARFDTHRERIEGAFVARGLSPPARIMRADSVALIGHVLQGSDAVALLGCNPFGSLTLPSLGALRSFAVPELSGPYRGILAWRRVGLLPAPERLMNMLREVIRSRLTPPSTI
ncbi:MAG: LysR family transcriptional regulator [Gammaproteobacteria bacterium]|nr:LysR family transcriptional regulator [Gammaproteobacteria bacterium]